MSMYDKERVIAEEARSKAIREVADWITSPMAAGLFGSASYGLRKQLAEIVRGREWETTLRNEEMRP